MYKLYSANGFDKESLREYEGTYETVGKALLALEEIEPLGYGYVFDISHKEVIMITTVYYGTIDCITTLKYDDRSKLIKELVELMDYIESKEV